MDSEQLPSRDVDIGTVSRALREDVKRILYPKSKVQTILEMGVYRGYTTRFLSEIFSRVYAIDNDDSYLSEAKKFNQDRTNVTYLKVDLNAREEWIEKLARLDPDCVFIDADHRYRPMKLAVKSCIEFFRKDTYIIFDDYADREFFGVQRVVNEFISQGRLRLIKKIGCPMEYGLTRGWHWSDYEGICTKIS